MTLRELSAQYFNKRGSKLARPNSYDSRIRPALAEFGDLPIEQISASLIEDWRSELERARIIHGQHRRPTAATVNRQVAELRRVLGWAQRRELLAVVPRVELEHEDNHRAVRVDSVREDQLLAAAAPTLRALIILALDTGMRNGEILELAPFDVDLERSVIKVRGAYTKSGKSRTLPINTVRLRSVIEWFLKRPGLTLTGVSRTARRYWWDQLVEMTQLQDLHWHDLRHEYASRLAERKVPVPEIQRLLGHAQITTTMRYISVTMDSLSTSAAVLEQGKGFDAGKVEAAI